jgi:hypothetical protein
MKTLRGHISTFYFISIELWHFFCLHLQDIFSWLVDNSSFVSVPYVLPKFICSVSLVIATICSLSDSNSFCYCIAYWYKSFGSQLMRLSSILTHRQVYILPWTCTVVCAFYLVNIQFAVAYTVACAAFLL